MYFVEILSKFINKLNNKDFSSKKPSENIVQEEEKCNHTFVPIDSTGNVLACINCGYVIHKDSTDINKKFEENK